MATNEQKLQRLFNLMDDDALTKEMFTKSFKNVIEHVLKLEKKLIAINQKTDSDLKEKGNKLQSTNQATEQQLKTFIGKELTTLLNKFDVKSSEIDRKVSNIKDGIDGQDGKDANTKKILKKLLKNIPDPTTPEEERDRLESLKGEERLDVKAINGLEELLETFKGTLPKRTPFGGSVVHKFADDEVPADSGDQTNFTLVKAPINGSLKLFRNGQKQLLNDATNGYTLSNKTITLGVALEATENLSADYRHI